MKTIFPLIFSSLTLTFALAQELFGRYKLFDRVLLTESGLCYTRPNNETRHEMICFEHFDTLEQTGGRTNTLPSWSNFKNLTWRGDTLCFEGEEYAVYHRYFGGVNKSETTPQTHIYCGNFLGAVQSFTYQQRGESINGNINTSIWGKYTSQWSELLATALGANGATTHPELWSRLVSLKQGGTDLPGLNAAATTLDPTKPLERIVRDNLDFLHGSIASGE